MPSNLGRGRMREMSSRFAWGSKGEIVVTKRVPNALVEVRTMTLADVEGAVALQRACFPPPFREELHWQPHHLLKHLEAFPEGQFVAVAGGCVVGSASNVRLPEDRWRAHLSWDETVGGLDLRGHDPAGPVLYGVDISVHPEWRGQGIARKLYEARFALVGSLGLRRYATSCRLPGFRDWLAGMALSQDLLERYLSEVAAGVVVDRTLTPLLKLGLRLEGGLTGHMDDEESMGCAASLEWTP